MIDPKTVKDVDALTPEELAGLKEYAGGKLYKISLAGSNYLVRPIYKVDWDIIRAVLSANPSMPMMELDDKIVDACLVAPRPDVGGWSVLPAGVVPSLSKFISAKSGFIVPELADQMDFFIEPLFEEGAIEKPDSDTITKLKATCPMQLKGVVLGNKYFVVRPITRQELRAIVKDGAPETEQDLKIVERAVLWPKPVDWTTEPAGYCDTLSQIVMDSSGYAGPTTVEEI